MRGVRIAGAAVVAGLVSAVITAVPTGSARADSTTVPGVLTTVSQRTGPLTVTVPPGTTPSAITGVLSMPAVVEGSTVTLLVNGRVAAQIPSTLYTKVAVPVQPTDVVADGTLALTMRYDAPLDASGTPTCDPTPEITLRKLGLDYTGVETPPSSVSTFFPANASRIDVKVPPDTGDDVLQAAFNAVASLSSRYSADTPVVLSTSDEPLATAGAGQRVVSFSGSGEGISTTLNSDFGVPTLVMSGSGLQLSDAARTLGSDALALADGTTTDGLARQVEARDEGLTRTLDQLRADAAGRATDSASSLGTEQVEVRQDSFGTPVSSLKVHLEGTHSAVPDTADARLDVYADDELVSSSVLGADPAIDLDFTIPASKLRSSTILRATVRSVADGTGSCSPGPPLELALDGGASTITATAGTGSLRGFQLFPQALDGRLPVAIRAGAETKMDDAIDAATLISSLQRQAATPLDVTIVDPDVFVKGQRSGLIVGAEYADSVDLNSPLRLSGTRLLNSADARFEVGSDTPFAALQAVARRGRFVLMLGSWAPGDVSAPPALSHRITDRIAGLGWVGLDDDVMIADDSGPPFTVDSGTTVTTTDEVAEAGKSYLLYFAAGIVALLLLLALQIVFALRRDRRVTSRGRNADDRGLEGAVAPAALPAARRTSDASATRVGSEDVEQAQPDWDDWDDWAEAPYDDRPAASPRRRFSLFRRRRHDADWDDDLDDQLDAFGDLDDELDDGPEPDYEDEADTSDVGASLSRGRQPRVDLRRR